MTRNEVLTFIIMGAGLALIALTSQPRGFYLVLNSFLWLLVTWAYAGIKISSVLHFLPREYYDAGQDALKAFFFFTVSALIVFTILGRIVVSGGLLL